MIFEIRDFQIKKYSTTSCGVGDTSARREGRTRLRRDTSANLLLTSTSPFSTRGCANDYAQDKLSTSRYFDAAQYKSAQVAQCKDAQSNAVHPTRLDNLFLGSPLFTWCAKRDRPRVGSREYKIALFDLRASFFRNQIILL